MNLTERFMRGGGTTGLPRESWAIQTRSRPQYSLPRVVTQRYLLGRQNDVRCAIGGSEAKGPKSRSGKFGRVRTRSGLPPTHLAAKPSRTSGRDRIGPHKSAWSRDAGIKVQMRIPP